MAEIKRVVKGMTCGMCVRHVREALEDLAGVEQAKVDLQKKEATIIYDESRVDLEEMQVTVRDAGYELV
jgi:copper chaperone CopZ